MPEAVLLGVVLGAAGWFLVYVIIPGIYTVDQNERAIKTVFGRAQRLQNTSTLDLPMAEHLRQEDRERYDYPQVRVIPPGGPYFKWPWEKVYKASVATTTANIAFDPETPSANNGGSMLDAVTKDHLNIGVQGQFLYRVSEQNLYAYHFGVKQPILHVSGYFISILRERLATFEMPAQSQTGSGLLEANAVVDGVSINDIRKNLNALNEHMYRECLSSNARYGISLDACLITEIHPPEHVEAALAAINTAQNNVSSEVSLARAAADQRIVLSRRAVEIETLNAQAEVQPLAALASQLTQLSATRSAALRAYVRNVRLELYAKAKRVILEEHE